MIESLSYRVKKAADQIESTGKVHEQVRCGDANTVVETGCGEVPTLRKVLRDLGGYTYRGEWIANTDYEARDQVKTSDQVIWLCLDSHTSANAFQDDVTGGKWSVWQMHNPGVVSSYASIEDARANHHNNVSQVVILNRANAPFISISDEDAIHYPDSVKFRDSGNQWWGLDTSADTLNVLWFGVVADCQWTDSAASIPTGTDNTRALQDAIDIAIERKRKLEIPGGEYLITDTLTVNGTLHFTGQSMLKTHLIFDMEDYTKSAMILTDAYSSVIEYLFLSCAGYLGKAGIEFQQPQAQAAQINHLYVANFRYGFATFQGESMSRTVFRHCQAVSCMYSGFYLESFRDGESFTHSAPLTFYDCLSNANGFHAWMMTHQYKGKPIWTEADKKYGYQVYVKGITDMTWYAGQVSNHGNAKNKAMIYASNADAMAFLDTDIEDIAAGVCVKEDGTPISSAADAGRYEGACVLVHGCKSVRFNIGITYAIRSPYFFKLLDTNRVSELNFSTDYLSDFEYSVHTDGINYSLTGNNGKIYTHSSISDYSPAALGCLYHKPGERIFHVLHKGFLNPVASNIRSDNLFSHIYGTRWEESRGGWVYDIGYRGDDPDKPDLEKGVYRSFMVSKPDLIYGRIFVNQNTFMPHGVGFVAQYEGDELKQVDYVQLQGLYAYRSGLYEVPFKFNGASANITELRFGFINSEDYTGTLPSHGRVMGAELRVYSGNPKTEGIIDVNPATVSGVNDQRSYYADSAPTQGGGHKVMMTIYNNKVTRDNPYLGWMCIDTPSSEAFGTVVNTTFKTVRWTPTLLSEGGDQSVPLNCEVGDRVKLSKAGSKAFYEIKSISWDTNHLAWSVELDQNIDVDVSGISLSLRDPYYAPLQTFTFPT